MSMDEFIKVMVIDGCFIIELFCKDNNDELIGENDPIFGVNCMMSMLTHDLILLENQIPWLVLESLFKKIITPDHVNLPLITLVTNFFNSLFCRGVEICQEVHKYENLHILDLLRNSLVLPSRIAKQKTNNTLSNDEWQVLPSATILVEAGIKFKKAEISNNILDIKFKNGVMEIPSLFIQDVTESLFRNLICFEQCLPFCEEVINSYLTFLDYLINSRKDVEIFSKEKIIENWIDNEETAVFLNRIVNDTSVDRFYYFDLVNEVNKNNNKKIIMAKKGEENDSKMTKSDEEVATVRIDVDPLADELENMMSHTVSMLPKNSPCIFRVPNVLSRHNPKAYAPNAFSFGPFHHNQPHLKATQEIKLRYLHELISRFPNTNPKTKLSELTTAIRGIQEEARECYDGSIDMSMDEFVKVMVIDGCFLIEYFRKTEYKNLVGKNDPIFGVKCMSSTLYDDMILLENQIPWLVLHCLFEKTTTPDVELSLITLVTNCFDGIFCRGVDICEEVYKCENKHILDLLRNSLILPSSMTKQERNLSTWHNEWLLIPSATVLVEAGIKFKKAEISSSVPSILDIKFKNGVIEIPTLFIQDFTESLFRNLLCFEQCLPYCQELIASYLTFLDYLINTGKDVQIFSEERIIENWTDNEEAAVFLNKICSDIVMWNFYYFDLVKDVNIYCRRRWPKYRRNKKKLLWLQRTRGIASAGNLFVTDELLSVNRGERQVAV
ncbi:hypothetical protein CsatB_021294 [Cannabis sativa]